MTQLLLATVLFVFACSSSQMKNVNTNTNALVDSNKVLIVYLSRTNTFPFQT